MVISTQASTMIMKEYPINYVFLISNSSLKQKKVVVYRAIISKKYIITSNETFIVDSTSSKICIRRLKRGRRGISANLSAPFPEDLSIMQMARPQPPRPIFQRPPQRNSPLAGRPNLAWIKFANPCR